MNLFNQQQQLTDHIRNPAEYKGPEGIEPRRLNIYTELFYNNVENFISNGFPVLRSIMADDQWHDMVRDFLARHRCHSPYFLEISEEFLLYLQNTRQIQASDPRFIQELAHYEWVELALDIADEDLLGYGKYNGKGDLLDQIPRVSPLAWSLIYQYPVHKIGEAFQPSEPGDQPTFLVVYRNLQDEVGFLETNAVTARLLELLQTDEITTSRQALQQIAEEIQHPDPQQVVEGGRQILQQLCSLEILLSRAK